MNYCCSLADVVTTADWQAYHAIRRSELFARHTDIVYDTNHPDERAPANYPLLLKNSDGRGLGTARLDTRSDGTLRRHTARGHPSRFPAPRVGRLLMALLESRARSMGIDTIDVNANPDAIGFYETLGYRAFAFDPSERFGLAADCLQMRKNLSVI